MPGVVRGRWYRRLAPASGITDFGFTHATLKPGAWSSQRHWHEGEDEFVVMLSGEAVLIDDAGEHAMRPRRHRRFPPRATATAMSWSTAATPTACSSPWAGRRDRLPLSRHRHASVRGHGLSAEGWERVLMIPFQGGEKMAQATGCSNCSITQSSACAPAIQSCI
ncbi:MAG: cupin domain-containing protein [Sphingomonas sp.]